MNLKFKLFALSALLFGAQIAFAQEAPKSRIQRLETKIAVLEERIDQITLVVASKGTALGVNCQCARAIHNYNRNGIDHELIPVSAATVAEANQKCKRYGDYVDARDCKVISPEKL